MHLAWHITLSDSRSHVKPYGKCICHYITYIRYIESVGVVCKLKVLHQPADRSYNCETKHKYSFSRTPSCQKRHNNILHSETLRAKVKYGLFMKLWRCFAESGPKGLGITEGTLNSVLHQKVLQENVRSPTREEKLKWGWAVEQDGTPKQTS